jgi:CRP/FNR family transcriptional regulator, anaerobic regulatory protein
MSKDTSKLAGSEVSACVNGCDVCPLRRSPWFQSVTPLELQILDSLKTGEAEFERGQDLISQTQSDGPLYTLLSGWAFRFKSLEDGRRQILSVLLPGDFVGLQQKMDGEASHGVRAITPVRACTFRRDALWRLHRELPSLGYSVTWLAAHGESVVDDQLLSVGRRNATERVAAFLLDLYTRAMALVVDPAEPGVEFPLTQDLVADAMGLSLVHTNRSLRALIRQGLCAWPARQRLYVPKPQALAEAAGVRWPLDMSPRPLI